MKFTDIDCAVPDCGKKATRAANISINNAPKKRLPVCKAHADAAREDIREITLMREVSVELQPVTVRIDVREAIDDLKKFNGLPPYDGFNPCAGDGIFAMSLEKKYGCSVSELSKAVNFKKLVDEWNRARAAFSTKFSS